MSYYLSKSEYNIKFLNKIFGLYSSKVINIKQIFIINI